MATTLETLQREKRDAILALAEKHGVYNVSDFGSVARGEDNDESDIDFLISLEQGKSLMNWSGFWQDMERLLERKVDVMHDKSLYWAMQPSIMTDATAL